MHLKSAKLAEADAILALHGQTVFYCCPQALMSVTVEVSLLNFASTTTAVQQSLLDISC